MVVQRDVEKVVLLDVWWEWKLESGLESLLADQLEQNWD